MLCESERKGKNSALNLGLKHAKNDIVIITDANALFNSSNDLRHMMRNFADNKVGGVAPSYFGRSKRNSKFLNEEENYWIVEDQLWKMESAWDSVSTAVGECFAFRRSLIGEIPPQSKADDLHCTITIIKKGYRVVYEPEAVVEEDIPSTLSEWFEQKKRRTVNTMMTFKNNLGVFFRYHPYGTIILPTHKLLTILSPLLLLGVGIFLLFDLLNPFAWFFVGAVALSVSIKFGRSDKRPSNALIKLVYFASLILVVFAAIFDYLFSRQAKPWKKTYPK